jgi:hypothetical protein
MKIAPSAMKPGQPFQSNKQVLLPLLPEEKQMLTKDNSISVDIRTTPADADSPKYKISVRVLSGHEAVRSVIQWRKDTAKVIRGLNITTALNKTTMLESMMSGTPLTFFQASLLGLSEQARTSAAALAEAATPGTGAAVLATDATNFVTDALVEASLDNVLLNIIPKKALQKVKRYLRRECRKPADMKVRMYFQHLIRINMQEMPCLPPFGMNQMLSDDEILDIILFGTPKSWQREMDRQGYDPLDHTTTEVVDFLEQIESSEEFDGTKVNSNKSKSHTQSKGKPKHENTPRMQKYCTEHGQGNHSTEECYKLHGKRHKPNTERDSKSKYANKTWTRKADEGNKKSKQELNSFMKKAIKAGVQKELAAIDPSKKKRKTDEDLAAFDIKDADLKEFNYDDMDNLKIDSDDDISV